MPGVGIEGRDQNDLAASAPDEGAGDEEDVVSLFLPLRLFVLGGVVEDGLEVVGLVLELDDEAEAEVLSCLPNLPNPRPIAIGESIASPDATERAVS